MRFNLFLALRGSVLDISRRQNAIVWISQLAIVFSTIVGVYLASSEGLKSAIEFHVATTTEKKFYTLSALHSEVENNNRLIEEFSENNLVKNDSGDVSGHRSQRIPELNWFVWTTMVQSSESLELPVDILRDVNVYYLELTRLSSSYRNSGGMDKLFNAKRLATLSNESGTALLQRMQNQLDAYQKSMRRYKGLGLQE